MYTDDGFRELGRQECARLLPKVPVGRIVYTWQALPAVLPVNFGLDHDGAVLVRTSASSQLVSAIGGAVVASRPTRSTRPRTPAGASSSPERPPW